MAKLAEFHAEANELERNQLLYEWLSDDVKRAALYRELKEAHFPVLRFKSRLGSATEPGWPSEDVYLLSGRADFATALKEYSVKPYQGIGSGGRFILAMDDRAAHDKQNAVAAKALRFTEEEIAACAHEAVRRAAVLQFQKHQFDLPDFAERVALRFVEVLFGFHETAIGPLRALMVGLYTKFWFQVIGRHFVPDPGFPPADSPNVVEVMDAIRKEIRRARDCPIGPHERQAKLPAEAATLPSETVIGRLAAGVKQPDDEELIIVVLGLIAGTISNIRTAVSITIEDFFVRCDLEKARTAARANNNYPALKSMIGAALERNPPAAFLARTATENGKVKFGNASIPSGAHVLIALGADADPQLIFGGDPNPQAGYLHRCIGEHLAWPLIYATVREVLLLPGLSREIDAASGEPKRLRKRWGVLCEEFPLQYQRDRRRNQQPLHLSIPIAEPVAENAVKLERLMLGGAHIVEDALNLHKHVHFAWFMLVENKTHLSMITIYDGDFDAYVEHFASAVELFNEQLPLLKDSPPLPVKEHPKEFVEWIRKHNRTPMAGYFYSAYSASVADIVNQVAP